MIFLFATRFVACLPWECKQMGTRSQKRNKIVIFLPSLARSKKNIDDDNASAYVYNHHANFNST